MKYDIFNVIEATAPLSFSVLFFAVGLILLFCFGSIFIYLSDRFIGADRYLSFLAVFVFFGPLAGAGFYMSLAGMAGFIVRLLKIVF